MDAGNAGRPSADKKKGEQHLRQDTAVHLEEHWPFRVLLEITRTPLRETRALAIFPSMPILGQEPS